MYICKKCGKTFENKHSYIGHSSSHNRGKEYAKKRETSQSRERKEKKNLPKSCKFCKEIFENGWILGAHIINCSANPDLLTIRKDRSKKMIGKKTSNKVKEKISSGMKKAHFEKRAWNIGKSRWNNEKSYPEKFFEEVIKNEFINKEYNTEYPVGIYSIDFAWPSLKKAIEIDGQQHERFEEYKKRDLKKDEFLEINGWKILRISWKEMFHNTKEKISEAYSFIHT